jgi:serine/threonine protein kinase/alpha-tubulin suppressor-like RCC1 family protein
VTRRPRSGRLPRIPELEEDYDILRELGRGGTAVVYLARERAVSRDVAIKLISPSHVRDEDAVARLIREARTVGKLQHPNIVMLLGTRPLSDGGLALILQYVPGRTLKERIQAEGALPYGDAEKILRDVGQALGYAHRQRIVHRDIKPENVYLDDSCDLARLADFGIARAWDSDSGLTLPGTAIGTPAYMSPEQVDGDELDGRSDLYGLGLMGYEMLTGRQPWAGESLYNVIFKQKNERLPPLTESCPDVPVGLRVAIEGAIRKRKEDRWPNAEAFLGALAGRSTLPPEAGAAARLRGEPEEQRTIRLAREVAERRARERQEGKLRSPERQERVPTPIPPPPVKRRSGVATGALILVALVALGLGFEAVVSGPDGYAHSLFGYLAPIIGNDSNGAAAPGGEPSQPWEEEGAEEEGDPVRPGVNVPPPEARSLEAILAAEGLLLPEGGAPAGEDPAPADPEGASPDVDAPETPGERAPAWAEAVGGTGQEGTVDGVLPQPLQVRVLDEDREPLADQVVRFEASSGSGRVEPATTRTDDRGIARALWVLGPQAGDQVVTATVEANPFASTRFTARGYLPRIPIRAGVSTGGTHSCMIGADGVIRCWGGNDAGQLGDGSRSGRTAAAAPVPQGPFATVAAGMSHACALDVEGRAFCWGSNGQGQLGSSGAPQRSAPTPVEGSARYSGLAAGGSHTCGITPAGAAYCWGDNDSGQLGDGSQARRGVPTRVRSDRVLRQITAGWRHTCAVDDGGAAFCWGSNGSGELGIAPGSSSSTPRAVTGGHRFRSVSAGASHACGVRTDGRIFCWGANQQGQLGDGTRENLLRPVRVAGDESFREVAAGGVHTCGLTADGRAFCWGGNLYGQVGDGTTTNRPEPVPVAGNHTFSALHAFGSHTCGRTTGGEVLCWGYNVDGQLGDGTRENRSVPTAR